MSKYFISVLLLTRFCFTDKMISKCYLQCFFACLFRIKTNRGKVCKKKGGGATVYANEPYLNEGFMFQEKNTEPEFNVVLLPKNTPNKANFKNKSSTRGCNIISTSQVVTKAEVNSPSRT